MSGKIMGLVWDLELSAPERMVLLAMADHAHHDGTNVFPSIGLVAWKTGYSESQTRRIIKKLVSAKLLSRQERAGYANLYTVHIENGVKKLPYKPMEGVSKENPYQNDTPTKMTPDPLHNYDTPTPVIAMTPEPSLEPSLNHGAKKSRKENAIPAAQMNPMKDAIAEAFGYSWEAMTGTEKGLVQKAAKELCTSNVTPDEVQSLYAYCKKRFDNFKPMALPGNVSEWRKTRPSKLIRDDGYIPVQERKSVLDGVELA